MACHIAELVGKDISELPFDVMTSEEVRHDLQTVTFATTTDGNHGRGVAWMARQLEAKRRGLYAEGLFAATSGLYP